jgi:hypothetical protein
MLRKEQAQSDRGMNSWSILSTDLSSFFSLSIPMLKDAKIIFQFVSFENVNHIF